VNLSASSPAQTSITTTQDKGKKIFLEEVQVEEVPMQAVQGEGKDTAKITE
jgi:hypothetical protein